MWRGSCLGSADDVGHRSVGSEQNEAAGDAPEEDHANQEEAAIDLHHIVCEAPKDVFRVYWTGLKHCGEHYRLPIISKDATASLEVGGNAYK